MPDHDDTHTAPSGPTAQPVEADVSTPAHGSDEPTAEPAAATVPRAELEKVIRERQAAKQRARDAEAKVAELTRADASDNATAELQRKLSDRESQLAAMLRDQQLHRAATRAGAINPDQVVAMLRSKVVMTEGPDGDLGAQCLDAGGRPLLDAEGTPADVDALVGAFLADAANANLLRPSTVPGSGARPGGATAEGTSAPATLAEFNALAPQQRRAAAMRMSARQREAMLGLGQPGRDGYL